MSYVFHQIEKKIIHALKEKNHQTDKKLESFTGLSSDQIRRGVEWLKLKDLVTVQESQQVFLSLGKHGIQAHSEGLPERQLFDLIKNGSKPIDELQKKLGDVFGPAMGIARKNNWISANENISLTSIIPTFPEEKTLKQIGTGKIPESQVDDLDSLYILKKRADFITQEVSKSKIISLSKKALKIDIGSDSESIDVEAKAPTVFSARTHPLNDIIQEIREIFVTLGFSEIIDDLSQSSFWNFDALFTPQDHPAREMQDTFYLEKINSKHFATLEQIRKISSSHKTKWKYSWNINEARKMVLRTHTTCVTIKHLAENKSDNDRIFSLGRVFRNEKVSYKHLAEFNQVEGVVVGKNTTLRDLMGIQLEFYRRIGLNKVKFWPTFFPYTEPSLQTMVYNERIKKWVELFGMGIFRSEVTKPLGITKPVLAWGGGIERIAMMKYGIDDVREFYNNDLKWLRSATKCQ